MSAKHIRSRRTLPVGFPATALLVGLSMAACGPAPLGTGGAVTTSLGFAPAATSFSALPWQPAGSETSQIRLVYAEPRSRTIATAVISVASAGESSVEASVLDRIAEGADASPDFGSHAYALIEGEEYLCYLDRAADGQLALKLLHRPVGNGSWNIDLLDPAGRPLCFLARNGEVHLVGMYGASLLDRRIAPDRAPASRLREGVRPEGPVSVVSSGNLFALYDAATRSMLVGRLDASGVAVSELTPPRRIAFGGPSSVRVDSKGKVCLFFADPLTRELLEVRDVGGARELRRITRARDVTATYTCEAGGDTLYVYTETTADAGGRISYALSLLLERPGRRPEVLYGRIATASFPFVSLQAHAADGELRVVALAEELELARLPLPDGTGR